MNYFAHARLFLDDPYMVAGTAVPDWLNVVNRRVKARRRLAEPFVGDSDPRLASVARGIVRHHDDDQWFHQTAAFAALSLRFTVELRDLLAPDEGFRPSFLGHILVELLLDAALIEQNPGDLDCYYETIAALDAEFVNQAVNRMATQPTEMLALLIGRFSTERFLYDYLDNEKLLYRLNAVMRRVCLSELPVEVVQLLPAARAAVRESQTELLAPPA
jgi:hypothetical protein